MAGDLAVGPRSPETPAGSRGTARTPARTGDLSNGHQERPADAPALRPYQLAGLAAIRDQYQLGCRSTLLELPTGTGKTVVFAELARQAVAEGGRMLVLAHREELLDQAVEKIAAVGLWAQVEQGPRRAGSAPVVVASVQTLRGARLERFSPSAFTHIVVDEGHHAVAEGYLAILAYFASARVLLVTASPDRGDGKALKQVCESVAFRYSLKQAIADEWLVPLRARRILVAGVDLSKVSIHHGDFDQQDLAEAFGDERALHGTAIPLLELAGDRRTIAFCVNVDIAKRLAGVLNGYRPGCARAVDGKAKRDERKAVLAAFRRGEFQFLINCALYTEGFDEPSIACVAIIRPTRSRGLYVQMLGRGTRLLGLSLAASIAAGKRDCLVLDFVGTSARNSLIGPADALAGAAVNDNVREAVEERLSAGELAVEEVLALAEDDAAKRRTGLKFAAIADYRAKEVDPFLSSFRRPAPSGAWTQGPATDKQRKELKAIGFETLPEGLTAGEASEWMDAAFERERIGLCSVRVARMLERANLDTNYGGRTMTAARAKQLHVKLIAANYKHPLLAGEPEYKAGWARKAKP